MERLLILCCKVIGPYTAYNFIPKAEVVLSDSGAQRMEANNAKTAFAYQITAALEQRLKEGEAATELLLQFLTEHTATFESWVNSEEFKRFKSLFIKTGNEFDFLYRTQQPFRNYFAMRFKMVDVEILTIESAITPSVFAYLKDKDMEIDPDWTVEEKTLLIYIKKSIAYLTVADSIPNLSVRIDNNGLSVLSDTGSARNQVEIRKDVDNDKLSLLISTCRESGKQWLNKAIEYIRTHPDKFPSYIVPKKSEHKKDGLKNSDYKGVSGFM